MEAVSLYLRPYGDRVLMPVTPYDPRLIVNTDNSEQVPSMKEWTQTGSIC